MTRRSSVDDDVDIFDCLIKRAVLGEILDNDQFKPILVVGKFVFEECTARK